MDNRSLDMENENSFDQGHFSSSWNEIVYGVENNFDPQAFTHFLGEASNSAFDNVLVNPQEIISADPNSSEEILNIIKEEAVPVSSTFISQPASLPASQNWPGFYDFNIGFNYQEKKTKGVTWTYNEERNKLYIVKDKPCPINFSTNSLMEGVQIRAMALYSAPDSASEVVERCINHAGEDRAKNIFEADHLVRCESPMVNYEMDPTTKRYSVVIPFENPPPGQSFSTYIFKFACFGSCPGPNRRPLMLVFSLEKDNQCIGRQKIDVKICACPGRDSKTEEESGPSRKRKKKTAEAGNSKALHSSNVNSSVSKKSKVMSDEEGQYKITVKDRKCFDFLEQMKKYYNIMKTIKNMPPDVRQVIEQYQQRKGYHIPTELTNLTK